MNTGIDKDVNKVKNNDTDDGWFNYTGQEEEDDIPRNTTKVRIDPSVKVIENKLFHKLWKRNVKLDWAMEWNIFMWRLFLTDVLYHP